MTATNQHAALGYLPIALQVVGELELPCLYLGYRVAISPTRPITAQMRLTDDGELRIDALDYSGTTTIVQLTPEQYAQLFDGLVNRAAPTVKVSVIEESVQTEDDQPWKSQTKETQQS